MPKENQRVALSKHLLKTNLLKLLQKKHIDKISISELCQKAEVNRTTFYRHYETPKDVFLEISLDYVKEFLNTSFSPNEPPSMKNGVLQLCRFVHRNAGVAKLLMQNSTSDDVAKIFHKLYENLTASRKILYKGEPVDNDTLHLFDAFLTAGIYTIINRWLIEEIQKTPEEIADLICRSFNTDFTFA